MIQALSDELHEASGQEVYPLSAAGGTGLEPVLDILLEHLGGVEDQTIPPEQPEDEAPWSPL